MNSIFALLRRFFHWFFEHLLGHAVTLPAIGLFTFIVGKTVDLQLSTYIATHPLRIASSLLALGLVSAGGTRVYLAGRRYVQLREIATSAGLNGFWPHSKDDEKIKNWNGCLQQIEKDKADDLRVLGVTGWATFGSPTSPLHNAFISCQGEIRVLLIKPGCSAFKERALALHINEIEYAKEIQDSLEFCKQLKRQGKSISVKLYEQTPIWKMVFTNNYLWLQYYQPDQHVDNTPVYTFFSNKERTSLYHPIVNVFRKRWHRDNNGLVNID